MCVISCIDCVSQKEDKLSIFPKAFFVDDIDFNFLLCQLLNEARKMDQFVHILIIKAPRGHKLIPLRAQKVQL